VRDALDSTLRRDARGKRSARLTRRVERTAGLSDRAQRVGWRQSCSLAGMTLKTFQGGPGPLTCQPGLELANVGASGEKNANR